LYSKKFNPSKEFCNMTTTTKSRSAPAVAHVARPPDRYLSVPEVAERLGTSERFIRRLIEERRIEFKRFGRHVRIAESVLFAYIDSCTVPEVGRRR
jgi:excisionase family DNA binding protein